MTDFAFNTPILFILQIKVTVFHGLRNAVLCCKMFGNVTKLCCDMSNELHNFGQFASDLRAEKQHKVLISIT